MSKQKWELKEHYEKPGWGVGDYDEYYEVVNERGDALQATEYDGLEHIADALNGFEGNLRITTALEINQHCDNQMLKAENDHLKAENSKMRRAMENGWVRVEDRLPGFKEPTRIPRAGQYPFVVIDVIDHNQYLVYTTCEVFELANFEKDGTWSFNNAEDEKVTHWRPLPAPPIATEELKTT